MATADHSPRRETATPADLRDSAATPATSTLVLAFASIYLIWGSTYLAIRFVVETIPPFLMLAARFLTAGAVMYAYLRLRGYEAPTPRQWRGATVVGGLLLLGGTGAVAWSEQWIPSGLAALLVSMVPIWMVLLDWIGPARRRPSRAVLTGLFLGLGGVALLVGPVDLGEAGRMQFLGSIAVVFGTLSWAAGSVYGQRFALPASPRMTAAVQMSMGGLLLGVAGTALGEWARLDVGAVSLRSLLSLAYLIVFGSWIAFAAYVFLLRHATPARVGSYAYVNPVVAMLLGWALADEPLSARTLLAAAVIIAGVVLIVTRRRPSRPARWRPDGAREVAPGSIPRTSPRPGIALRRVGLRRPRLRREARAVRLRNRAPWPR